MSRALLVAAAAMLWLWAPRAAFACSCRRPPQPDVSLDKSGAVFAGTVTSIRCEDTFANGFVARVRETLGIAHESALGLDDGCRMELAVTESWKGVETTTATVFTGIGGGDCGLGLDPGEAVLIYAAVTDGMLSTNICTRSGRLDDVDVVAEDLPFLAGKPRLALHPRRSDRRVWVAVACAAPLAVFAVWLFRRGRLRDGQSPV